MKITIEKTQSVKTEIEVPQYFVIMSDWFHMVLPNGKIMRVTNDSIGVWDADQAMKHLSWNVTPCTQDEFIAAYCKIVNMISQASGIEHLPLLIDNTSNPES